MLVFLSALCFDSIGLTWSEMQRPRMPNQEVSERKLLMYTPPEDVDFITAGKQSLL